MFAIGTEVEVSFRKGYIGKVGHGCKGDADFESDSGAPFCGECLFGE